MSIFDQLNKNFRIDAFSVPSDLGHINCLIANSSILIPDEFLQLIQQGSNFEIYIGSNQYVRIWGAENCIELNVVYKVSEYTPDSLAIGDNEGGYMLIYANGRQGFGLYLVAFNDLDFEEMKYVSSSLSKLLIEADGVETIINPY